jgi:menaquinone-dependent protoporphyrinogen oxidase
MPRVQVVYASRHGGTAGIADRIAEVLRSKGIEAIVEDAASQPDPARYDGHVVGSAVYMGSWLKEGIAFLEANEHVLAARPVWLFSSGPLPGSTKDTGATDRLELALGPEHGPGSGGRQRVTALSEPIHPRDHRVFQGAFDPNDSPRTLSERVIRLMPGAKGILPEGDFREWDEIEAWARQIAAALAAQLAPVRAG